MVTIEPEELTAIRPANDIDWLEEEAWRRASQWIITPALVFAIKAMMAEENTKSETDPRA
jgi:hypothetical protein